MFYVLQKPHIKRSPNGIKTDGEYFWNIYDFWEEETTRDDAQGGHEAGGRAPYPREPTIRRLTLFFFHKKANIRKKNHGEGFRPIEVTDLRILKKQ